ncbi:MAG TPA: MOSC N-terminal beta barrel domain-containing protein [Opitutaceae bacterium]|nr:MOSC N-terminal beta barrel domain-containing protein [Opitutaceae bacterium]
MHLSALFIYPVKSLRGVAVSSAEIDTLGFVGDRRFLIVDETGRFLTQRALPAMARIATALDRETLTLSAEGVGSIAVTRTVPAASAASATRSVTVWKSTGLLADDCGDAPAAWLSDFLKTKCRLVRVGEKFLRPVLKPAAGPADLVHFADAVPFLVIGEASLADLNDRLVARHEEPLPMNRFRPNLVIAGSQAFAEDDWPRFRIGEIVFRAAGPCARCIVTTTDQLTGERGREPLRTLATYRRGADPTDVNFGQNLIHETKSGTLRVGDPVHLL